MRRETDARRVSDMLALSEHHRELWSEVHRRPELSRIMDSETDLIGKPTSAAEEQFLFIVITHFHTGWHLARKGALLTLEVLAEDAGWFFNLPIPRAVWEGTKNDREAEFVAFIEASRQSDSERKSKHPKSRKKAWWK